MQRYIFSQNKKELEHIMQVFDIPGNIKPNLNLVLYHTTWCKVSKRFFCTLALRNFQNCSLCLRKDDTDLTSEVNDN